MSSLRYWVWLSLVNGVGAKKAMDLIEYFGSVEQVYFSREEDLRKIVWLKDFEISNLMKKDLTPARNTLEKCEENGYKIITVQDAQYPERLKNIYDPPILMYIWGSMPVIDEEALIAIVGTRSCTPYGVVAAEKIGYEITRAGCNVVSGLAEGIDTAAIRGALRAGGRPVAVTGSGLDVFFPEKNRSLFHDVAATGAVISEFPPGTRPVGRNFPIRNRIISGLSLGVAVIEAPKKSGALITAARALEQGRDVFAVPGNIDSPACGGSNQLIRDGAILITCGRDIVDEYVSLFPQKLGGGRQAEVVPIDESCKDALIRSTVRDGGAEEDDAAAEEITKKKERPNIDDMELSDNEKKIVSVILDEPKHIDDIIVESGLPAAVVLSALTMLQINGHVIQLQGKIFSLAN